MAEYFGNICTCRKCNGIVHTIRRGDTLYLLSRYYNVTINEIMRANANVNIYNLQIGDQICIPVRRPMPTTPARPGQNQPPQQPQRPQRPPMMRPRDDDDDRVDDLDDLLEDILEGNNRDRMQSGNMQSGNMQSGNMQSGNTQSGNMQDGDVQNESVPANAQTMTEDDAAVVEVAAPATSTAKPCCGGMKVKDVLMNEDMTLEELAMMLKNM